MYRVHSPCVLINRPSQANYPFGDGPMAMHNEGTNGTVERDKMEDMENRNKMDILDRTDKIQRINLMHGNKLIDDQIGGQIQYDTTIIPVRHSTVSCTYYLYVLRIGNVVQILRTIFTYR